MSGSQADFWQGPTGTLPVVNANGNIFEEVQVAAGGQTVFTLATFTYTLGTKSIWVFRKTAADAGVGGEMLRRVVDYAETASNKITLLTPAVAGDTLTFIAFGVNQLIAPVVNNGIPQGGATGAVLQKSSGSDFDAAWVPQSSVTTLLDSARQNVASASTVSLVAIANQTRNINITGGIQIDGFQITNGQVWAVKFAGALTLKNNANTVTETGADIITTPNATCFLRAIADNTVEVLSYSGPMGDEVLGSINSGAIGGKRNLFYNGGMTNSQRGQAVLAATGQATVCDGWFSIVSGTTVSTTILQLAYAGATTGFVCDFAALTTTGATIIAMHQRIEAKNSKRLSGKTVTVSGKIRHSAPITLTAEVDFIKPTATDNYAGTTTIGGVGGLSIPPAVDVPFSATFTLGATDADLGLEVNIFISTAAVTGISVFFFDMQIEVGRVATPFEHQSVAMTDLESKRYLICTNYGTPKGVASGGCSGIALTTSILAFQFKYPVQMRALPTFQLWNNGVQNQIHNSGTGVIQANTISGVGAPTLNGFGIIVFGSATLVAGNGYDFDLIISCEL